MSLSVFTTSPSHPSTSLRVQDPNIRGSPSVTTSNDNTRVSSVRQLALSRVGLLLFVIHLHYWWFENLGNLATTRPSISTILSHRYHILVCLNPAVNQLRFEKRRKDAIFEIFIQGHFLPLGAGVHTLFQTRTVCEMEYFVSWFG